jgi:hypothetical protein
MLPSSEKSSASSSKQQNRGLKQSEHGAQKKDPSKKDGGQKKDPPVSRSTEKAAGKDKEHYVRLSNKAKTQQNDTAKNIDKTEKDVQKLPKQQLGRPLDFITATNNAGKLQTAAAQTSTVSTKEND